MPSVAGEIAECRRSIYTITLVTLGCAIFPHVAVCVYIIGIHAYACISQVACVHTCMYVKVVGRYRPIEHHHTCSYGWSGTQVTRRADQPALFWHCRHTSASRFPVCGIVFCVRNGHVLRGYTFQPCSYVGILRTKFKHCKNILGLGRIVRSM